MKKIIIGIFLLFSLISYSQTDERDDIIFIAGAEDNFYIEYLTDSDTYILYSDKADYEIYDTDSLEEIIRFVSKVHQLSLYDMYKYQYPLQVIDPNTPNNPYDYPVFLNWDHFTNWVWEFYISIK